LYIRGVHILAFFGYSQLLRLPNLSATPHLDDPSVPKKAARLEKWKGKLGKRHTIERWHQTLPFR
jgi:hypothetical protein